MSWILVVAPACRLFGQQDDPEVQSKMNYVLLTRTSIAQVYILMFARCH